MKTLIIPQEIFLLERYTSIEYFEKLRNVWGEMILHLDKCLGAFMANLPPNYRNRPLPEQPDIVWGDHVISNFRDTFKLLCDGYIKLSHGDIGGLAYASAPLSDFKGQMDFWSAWMNEQDEYHYRELLMKAVVFSGNIQRTEGAYWNPRALSEDYNVNARGELDPPKEWPRYRLRTDRNVKSDSPVIHAGFYIPQIEHSCAQFLSTSYPRTPQANIITGKRDLFHPTTGEKYAEEYIYEKSACVWILVERHTDIDNENISSTMAIQEPAIRLMAGEICKNPGYYFTPAKINSRKLFNTGNIMPTFKTDYGTVIWQWDVNQ